MNSSIQGLGPLYPYEYDPEELCSDEISVNFFGGTPLQFIITEPLSDPMLVQQIEKALQNFFQLDSHYRDSVSDWVYQDYDAMLSAGGVDDLSLDATEDIWKYVYPSRVYVEQREEDRAIYIVVNCECEWEFEHGLQLVFKDGAKLTRVSGQDGHLTDEDAYGRPDPEDPSPPIH